MRYEYKRNHKIPYLYVIDVGHVEKHQNKTHFPRTANDTFYENKGNICKAQVAAVWIENADFENRFTDIIPMSYKATNKIE